MIEHLQSPADEAMAEFLAHLQGVQARRAQGLAPKLLQSIDGPRIAQAFRAKPRAAAPAAPTRRAASAAAICRCCGARGEHGCAHFLPFTGELR